MSRSKQAAEIEDFEEILDEAESNANLGFEEEFVSDMRDRFKRYGFGTMVSERQEDVLKRIAKYEG